MAHLYPDRYSGDPAARPDLSPSQEGDVYIATDGDVRVHNGIGWTDAAGGLADLGNRTAANKGAALVGWFSGLPGGAGRDLRSKLLSLPLDFEDFGAVGDGAADDTDALVHAASTRKRVVAQPGRTYRLTKPLVLQDPHIDFSGCTLKYEGPRGQFAVVVNASGAAGACQVRNFVLSCAHTDTNVRTHGVCLGGSLGVIENFRVQGFTGVQLALGSGLDHYTGVVLPARFACLYWDVSNASIASTAGWNVLVKFRNNANKFRNLCTFPYDGFGVEPPRPANCINEVIVGGLDNTFDRTSLEASPSREMVVLLPSANGNVFTGMTYIEYNPKWATPPFPRIRADAGSSANQIRVRHPYPGQRVFSDLGTANELRSDPAYYINGGQKNLPAGGASMVRNGQFLNGARSWRNASTRATTNFQRGSLSGRSMRIEVAEGRVMVSQDLVADAGYSAAGLSGQNVTVSAFVRTNIAQLQIRVAGLSHNGVDPDGEWHWFTSTIKIPPDARAVPIQLASSDGARGFAEWSDVAAVIGTSASAVVSAEPLEGSAQHGGGEYAAGASAPGPVSVAVAGAEAGDFVAGVSYSLDTQGVDFRNAWIAAPDTVHVLPHNPTAMRVRLGPGTLRVQVVKKSS